MNIGMAIKLIRTRKKWDQKDLAAVTGLSVAYISLIEQDKREATIKTLQWIAFAFNLKLSKLIEFAEMLGDEE